MKTIVLGYDESSGRRIATSWSCTEGLAQMSTTTHPTTAHTADGDEVDRLASDADDDAGQPAMDVESAADACEIVARQVATLRADAARQRVKLAELREARR